MSIIRKKRSRAIIFGLVAALVVAGGAIAFWTSSGTGAGTASVGTDSGLPISAVTFGNTLYPGGKSPVSFTITNSSANSAITVAQVAADTSFGTTGVTGLPGGCSAADFTFPTYTVNQSIPAGGTLNVTVPTASGLAFANTASNQDSCKGAAPVLHLKAS
jgi:hypothetical protein